MKITIEIEDGSKLAEALAAEIAKSKKDINPENTKEQVDLSTFSLQRPDTSRLTCVAFSCGI